MFIYRFASPLPVHDQLDNVPFIVSMKEGRTSLSLWHKSVADLAVRIDAGLANSNPGADCIHRVPLAVDSVGGTPHDNHLSHGSRRSFGGQWASGTSDIIRDSPQAVPCAHERQDVA